MTTATFTICDRCNIKKPTPEPSWSDRIGEGAQQGFVFVSINNPSVKSGGLGGNVNAGGFGDYCSIECAIAQLEEYIPE